MHVLWGQHRKCISQVKRIWLGKVSLCIQKCTFIWIGIEIRLVLWGKHWLDEATFIYRLEPNRVARDCTHVPPTTVERIKELTAWFVKTISPHNDYVKVLIITDLSIIVFPNTLYTWWLTLTSFYRTFSWIHDHHLRIDWSQIFEEI